MLEDVVQHLRFRQTSYLRRDLFEPRMLCYGIVDRFRGVADATAKHQSLRDVGACMDDIEDRPTDMEYRRDTQDDAVHRLNGSKIRDIFTGYEVCDRVDVVCNAHLRDCK